MKKILAFAGSNSLTSINHILVKEAADLITDAEVQLISLRDFEAPVYGIDLEVNEGFPNSMVELYGLFTEVDGFIVGVPEHNGSMPAVMKNTLDWISRQGGKIFQNKPVVFLGTSPGGRGAASAMKHVLEIMPHRGANIVGHYSLPNFNDHFISGTLNAEVLEELSELMNNLGSTLKAQ
ncbi:MAG: NADPH-dependent FMN reductase [Crocinitomicaceae bacterium]